jgi:hypothetical protein
MAKAKEIDTGRQKFPSKKAAKDYFSKMLNRYCVGERVSDAHAVDLEAP